MENVIRVGKVSAVDYQTGMVRVVYHDKDDSVTRPIPTLSAEYKMPEIGDQVLVVHLSTGTEAGVVLGRPWSDKNRPPESGAGLYRKDLGRAIGEAVIRYLDGAINVKAGAIHFDGDMTIKGDLKITGDLTVTGGISANEVTATADVVAGGISLVHHTHTCSCAVSSGTTSPPM